MKEPKKVIVVWVTDYGDHFVEGKVFDDKDEVQAYNDEMFASKSPFIAGAEMEELEYFPKTKAKDIVNQIESMDNGERISTLKLLHETYFYSRDFPSDIEEDPQRYTLEEVKERFYPNNYKPIKLTGKDA
ncbi:hypothetical protein J7E63_14395 [Bacillus sp. ISL-75]|uniref:hypothetical protein n=1 Tax=Bacillus sp. ISL-75 TaxID=2819137 RepID=UPI001BE5437C|nr:hypothetical protein [Bacillus sp. ISL-75]MBT2728128.1 hypothetical protein [Bacillus sp. ISL-75]